MADLNGFDVTALSVEAFKRYGVTTGAPVVVERAEHRLWKTHSEFLGEHPAWDVTDRMYARAFAAAYVVRRRALADTLEAGGADESKAAADRIRAQPLAGLRLPRSFPCLGVLRVLEEHGRMVIVGCDICGETFGVSTPPTPEAEDDRPRRRRRPQEKVGDEGMPF